MEAIVSNDIQELHELQMQLIALNYRERVFKIRLLWLILPALLLALCSQAQTTYHPLEVSYIALNAYDVILTYKGINMGGMEVNKFAKWTIDNHLLIPGKVIFTSGFLLLCRAIRKDNPRLALYYLMGGNLVYSAVVLHNYQICLRLKI